MRQNTGHYIYIMQYVSLHIYHAVEPLYNEHLGPDIFSHLCISKTNPVETKIFVLIMEVFSIVSLIRRV